VGGGIEKKKKKIRKVLLKFLAEIKREKKNKTKQKKKKKKKMSGIVAGDGGDAPPRPARVLSIQSHVVHGYVGNRCATFPLQLLGIEVDVINSVQFSNHTGYPGGHRGEVLGGDALTALVDGLDTNGLLAGFTHLLTGYIGSASFLRAVADVLRRLRAANPGLVYVCDPVLGDDGRLYVPPGLVTLYAKEVMPLADVVTPNAFETELLLAAGQAGDELGAGAGGVDSYFFGLGFFCYCLLSDVATVFFFFVFFFPFSGKTVV
jgi:hypothetical protein